MSNDSPPPSPDYLDAVKKITETLTVFAEWLVKLIQGRNWFTFLLLIGAVVLLLFKPDGGLISGFLDKYYILKIANNPTYTILFWLFTGLIFLSAIIYAVITTPAIKEPNGADLLEKRTIIKGLRAFTAEDAEIFLKLQRDRDLQECLDTLRDNRFDFGILVGESGSGKTSFLQAGIYPTLSIPESSDYPVYIRFDERDPIETVRSTIIEKLQLNKEEVNNLNFSEFLTKAVAKASKPVILLFDQFEQFFVHYKQKQDREPFIKVLTDWYKKRDTLEVKILISIREDFSGRLIELQKALGYSLAPQEVFLLEKLTPAEATKILGEIAKTEGLKFDEKFVMQMAEKELAKKDGLISPVDLQILALTIDRQKTEELRAFDRKAFQKIGGMNGLLSRFLDRTLLPRKLSNEYKSTVKVLLALTDLNGLARAGVLTITELQTKLRGGISSRQVLETTNWLARSDVRLITPVDRDGNLGYELAHERIIPALMRLAGRELTAVARANQLLNTRVNEWLSNDCKSRFLSWIDLFVIQKHKPYLIWDNKQRQKENLLKASWERFRRQIRTLVVVLLLILFSIWWWFFSPWGQIYQVRSDLIYLSKRVNDETATEAVKAFAKKGLWTKAFKIFQDDIEFSAEKAIALIYIAETTTEIEDKELARILLETVLEKSDNIFQSGHKVWVLKSVIKAADKLDNDRDTEQIIGTIFNKVDLMQFEFSIEKGSVLISLAEACGKLDNLNRANKLLQQAAKIGNEIERTRSKIEFATSLAEAYGKLNNIDRATQFLQEVLNKVDNIEFHQLITYSALTDVIKAIKYIEDNERTTALLDQVFDRLDNIQDSGLDFKRSVLEVAIEQAGKLDNLEHSIKLLEQVFDSTHTKRYLSLKVKILTNMVEVNTKLDRHQKTIELLEKALEISDTIDIPYYQTLALKQIAETAKNVEDFQLNINLLQKATLIANKIKDSDEKAKALSFIAEAYGQVDLRETGLKLLEQALEYLYSNPPTSSNKAKALITIANAYRKLDRPRSASSLLIQALQNAEDVQSSRQTSEYKDNIFISIAKARAELGNWRQARHVADKCTSDVCKLNSLAATLIVRAQKQNPPITENKNQQ